MDGSHFPSRSGRTGSHGLRHRRPVWRACKSTTQRQIALPKRHCFEIAWSWPFIREIPRTDSKRMTGGLHPCSHPYSPLWFGRLQPPDRVGGERSTSHPAKSPPKHRVSALSPPLGWPYRLFPSVVRRLRLGVGGSLYKKAGESLYTVDLSTL